MDFGSLRARQQVDHRADIYSLGVMLYEMLCGEVLRGVFEPPSRRAECDPGADRVVTRAMQQEPALHYQSTQEMKTDVDVARTPLPNAERREQNVPLGRRDSHGRDRRARRRAVFRIREKGAAG